MEALAADLRERAAGRVIDRADVAEISVLKTYDPALTALRGRVITGTKRYGKFLDLATGPAQATASGAPLHLIVHLARAGWLRWRDSLPDAAAAAGQGPAGVPAPVHRRLPGSTSPRPGPASGSRCTW